MCKNANCGCLLSPSARATRAIDQLELASPLLGHEVWSIQHLISDWWGSPVIKWNTCCRVYPTLNWTQARSADLIPIYPFILVRPRICFLSLWSRLTSAVLIYLSYVHGACHEVYGIEEPCNLIDSCYGAWILRNSYELPVICRVLLMTS